VILPLVGTALLSLRHHALRSSLTMLGIIFGVAAVVAMTAISEGARAQSLREVESMGLGNILVRSQKPSTPADRTKGGTYVLSYGITAKDRERIAAAVPGVAATIATRLVEQKVWAGPRRVNAQVFATEPAWLRMANLEMRRGRAFNDLDMQRRQRVAVIGDAVAREIFRYRDPIGQGVRIGDTWFTVVGVVAKPSGGGGGMSGDEIGRGIFLPEPAVSISFGSLNVVYEVGSIEYTRLEVSTLVVALAEGADVIRAGELIRHLMGKAHEKDDYAVVVPRELLEQKRRTQRIFTIVMGSIASISLLVGGIGIMNIMLATVFERTREIGIRRAIGASRSDILAQFLTETVVLSFIGGLGGLALGVGGAIAVSRLSEWPTILSPWSMMLAVGISGFVGVVFGIYPAVLASRMQPVEALRAA